MPFVQVAVADGRPVGMTNYLELRFRDSDRVPFAVEIGGTWLGASAQRTGINVEAKLLLLGYAFDEWKVARVDLKTDALEPAFARRHPGDRRDLRGRAP